VNLKANDKDVFMYVYFGPHFSLLTAVVTTEFASTAMPLVCSASWGELGLYPKGALPVKVTSQTRVSIVVALQISIMLPPFSFGFPKQITDNCFVQNCRNS